MKDHASENMHGGLLIIDGPSAVGKSTIVNALLSYEDFPIEVAPRVTTRQRRPEDDDTYIFIGMDEYERMVANNELLEYHCYLFGMCYGLPRASTQSRLDDGKLVLGMINLGNFPYVRAQIKNSFGVFLNASLDTIRYRLESRQVHTPEQIDERLGNARRGQSFISEYDLMIMNENRSVDSVVDEIVREFRTFLNRAASA